MAYNYAHFRTRHVLEEAEGMFRLRGPAPGDPAPEFTLWDTRGEPWRLADRRGTPVLLHFGSYT